MTPLPLRMRLFLGAWALAWHLLLPLVLGYLWWRGRKDRLYRCNLAERFGHYATGFPDGLPGPVWVHAVSLGEIRSAVPLIRLLLERGDRVVTTHFTPAGRREAERVFAADIAAGALRAVWIPFETAAAFRGFFRSFRPVFGLVMEIEIWPRMVFASRDAKLPLLMCNAQYPSRSLARDGRGLRLRQAVMRGFAGALVKSDLQAGRFGAIGVTNIAVTGELRFDQPIPADLVAAGVAARSWLGAAKREVIAIASAVEGEDAVYLRAMTDLRVDRARRGMNEPLFIYVPRKPERFGVVADLLLAAGLTVQRRSVVFAAGLSPQHGRDAPGEMQVLLGDSLGEMYFYLAMADRVIVGGGFTPNGAHNIIEALALRKPVLTGPQVFTIEYPFSEAEACGVATSVADAPALSAALVAVGTVPAAAIDRFFAEHAGAASKTLEALPGVLSRVRF